MWLLLFVLLPCIGGLLICYFVSLAMLARERQAAHAACLLADLHAAHEAIPINEERRERELAQLRAMWSRS